MQHIELNLFFCNLKLNQLFHDMSIKNSAALREKIIYLVVTTQNLKLKAIKIKSFILKRANRNNSCLFCCLFN